MMETLVHYYQEVRLEYVEQFLAALLPMALTVAIHGEGMGLATRYFKRFGTPAAGRWSRRATSVAVDAVS